LPAPARCSYPCRRALTRSWRPHVRDGRRCSGTRLASGCAAISALPLRPSVGVARVALIDATGAESGPTNVSCSSSGSGQPGGDLPSGFLYAQPARHSFTQRNIVASFAWQAHPRSLQFERLCARSSRTGRAGPCTSAGGGARPWRKGPVHHLGYRERSPRFHELQLGTSNLVGRGFLWNCEDCQADGVREGATVAVAAAAPQERRASPCRNDRSLCEFMVGIRAKSFEKALVEVEVVHGHLTGQEVEGSMNERSTTHAD